MTFCEMHKSSGGCQECPNRYVCKDSTYKESIDERTNERRKALLENKLEASKLRQAEYWKQYNDEKSTYDDLVKEYERAHFDGLTRDEYMKEHMKHSNQDYQGIHIDSLDYGWIYASKKVDGDIELKVRIGTTQDDGYQYELKVHYPKSERYIYGVDREYRHDQIPPKYKEAYEELVEKARRLQVPAMKYKASNLL